MDSSVQRSSTTTSTAASRKKRNLRFSLTFGITGAIVFSSLVSALFMHTAWRLFVVNSATDLSTRINEEIFNAVRNEVSSVFRDVIRIQRTIYNIFDNELVNSDNEEEIKSLYINTMTSNTEFSWISLGLPDGGFLGVQRAGNDTLRWHASEYDDAAESASRIIETYQYEQGGRSVALQGIETLVNEYYSPTRPWFIGASQVPLRNNQWIPTDIWTDVYIFNTSQVPGINSAVALRDPETFALDGVISIAIDLARLSEHLAGVNISRDGVLFIINQQQELIAYQDKDEVVALSEGSGRLALRTLAASNDVRLRVVNESIRDNSFNMGSGIEKLTSSFVSSENNTEYSIFLRPISDSTNKDLNLDSLGWYIGTTIPTVDILGAVEESSRRLLIIVYSIIAAIITVVFIFVRFKLIKPIRQIADQADYIRQLELESVRLPSSSLAEIDLLTQSISRINTGLNAFKKYVPTELVQQLINKGLEAKLGGVECDTTIFFSDIVRFTYMSEVMREDIVEHLDAYFTHLSNVIKSYEGTIDKYIGDAIMAFWGAPNPQPDHAIRACNAALRCAQTLSRLRADWKNKGKELLYARFGINSGRVLVGNFGSHVRMSYTAIGDAVNVASRLEALNKIYGTEIIIGESTYEHVSDYFVTRKLDRVSVYGRAGSIEIAELIAAKNSDYHPDQYEWITFFEQALQLYRAQKWEAAAKSFLKAHESRDGEDNASLLFIKRCQHLMSKDVPHNWSGTFILQTK